MNDPKIEKKGMVKVQPDIIDSYPQIYQCEVKTEDTPMHLLHPEAN